MKKRFVGKGSRAGLCAAVLLGSWLLAERSFAQPPSAAMSFMPEEIGERTSSTLAIVFTNSDPGTPASDLAVTHNVPAGLRIATPSNASTDCVNALVSAPEGGTTIALSDGRIGANTTCALTVDITGDSAGTFDNVSGDVTSSAGNGGTASAQLSILDTLPVFEMSFVPSSVPFGGTSTLTYSIENRLATPLQSVTFRNAFPPGMVVASPANVSTTCDTAAGPPLVTQPGATGIDFFLFTLGGGVTCTTRLDVTAGVAGTLGNTTEPLTFFDGADRTTGKAGAMLDVTVEPLNLAGFFSGDPVRPGETLFLDFTIDNLNRDQPATDIAFSDNLDAALGGLVALGLPRSDVCGAGSMLSGISTIGLTGGSLPAEGTCSFRVEVQVPGNAAPGIYTHTSSEVTAEIDGRTVNGSRAVDSFEVNEAPVLEKTFLTNPLPAGESTTMELTITQLSLANGATEIGFVDSLDAFIPGIVVPTLPPAGFCGAGSTLVVQDTGMDRRLVMTGGSLAPGASCTFSLVLDVPIETASGRYSNRTEPITAIVDGSAVTGKAAAAALDFVAAPELRKAFAEARVAPGDPIALQFELSYGENAPGEATGISFVDDLSAMLSGLQAVGLPIDDVCGPGSRLEGTSLLVFSGGTVAPMDQCTFEVTLDVPSDASSARYTNTTGEVTATVTGLSVLGAPATADLEVTSVVLEKAFVQDPAFAGDTVPLRFTITNSNASEPATAMSFVDDLSAVLAGLAATGLPQSDVCGAGSTISGTSSLIFTGGNVPAASSCTFDVDVQIPADTIADSYNNVTGAFSFTIGGTPAVVSGATSALTISEALSFAKAFDADVVAPGDSVALEFTIDNAHPTLTAEELTFTDDLSAALPGLEALGLPASDVCGAGSMLSGTDVITLTGGAVAPGSSCTFSVELQVPGDVATGTSVTNVTSELTGLIDGFPRTAAPARDELAFNLATLAKAFEGAAEQGGSTTLTFTVENLNSASTVTGVSFTDDLDAVLPGLVATGTPINDVCGEGSVLDGSSVLMLRNGSVGPGESCTFNVTVEAPIDANPGDYENVTSELSTDEGVVGDTATATLTVVPGTADGGGGGCGCRTTEAKDAPFWLFAFALFLVWRLRRGRQLSLRSRRRAGP